MNKKYKLLLISLFVSFCISPLLLAAAHSAGTEELFGPVQIKKLMVDPRVSDLYVAPPRHLDALMVLNALTASFVINYLPAGSDPYGIGDTCVTFPEEAKDAFEYAADIWASQIVSPVPIIIDACWASNLPDGALGHSAALGSLSGFTGAPQAGTWYNYSLANALAGVDLRPADSDMYIAYSNSFPFYYDTAGVTPVDKFDFATIVLHEIAHSLNFSGSMRVSSGSGSWGLGSSYPSIYDRFTVDSLGEYLIDTSIYANNSAALAAALQSGEIFFTGAHAKAANGSNPVALYAPAVWSSGSSYSHVDEIFNDTADALMTYSVAYGEQVHNVGAITKGILQDLGWQIPSGVTTTSIPVTDLNEGFEGDTFPPQGWSRLNALGSKYWLRSTSYFNDGGTASAFIDYEADDGEDWLITPKLTSIAAGSILTFWWRRQYPTSYPPDNLEVLVSTTDSQAGSFIGTLASIDTAAAPNAWTEHVCSLGDYAGQDFYLAFKHTNTDGNGGYLDDVSVSISATTTTTSATPTTIVTTSIAPTTTTTPVGGLNEGFEDAVFPPVGWSSQNVLGPQVWARSIASYNTGTACAFIQLQASGGEDWLITPKIASLAADSSLKFWWKRQLSNPYPPDQLDILISTVDNATGSFTETLGTISATDASWESFTQYSYSLSDYAGQAVYIAFKHTNTDGNGGYLDDVSVSALSPTTTTSVATSTTSAPATTTSVPVTTTSAPVTTTSVPVTTTSSTTSIGSGLNEGFEDISFPPAGWTSRNSLGTKVWARSTSYYNSGEASAFMDFEAPAGEDWLITPKLLSLPAGSSLSFWWKRQFSSAYPPDQLEILISTTDTEAGSFTGTLATIDTSAAAWETWTEHTFSLGAYAGQDVFIAFKHTDANGNGGYLDDVAVSVPETTTTTSAPSTTTTSASTTTTSAPTTTTSAPTTTTSAPTTTTIDSTCPASQVLGQDNSKLQSLRSFRDSRLARSAAGQMLIRSYYKNAGSINAALERSPALRGFARRMLELVAQMVEGKKAE